MANLSKSLHLIGQEDQSPKSKKYAEKLLTQVAKYQENDDPEALKDINDTLTAWKESDFHKEWPDADINNAAARGMLYVLKLGHASLDQRRW